MDRDEIVRRMREMQSAQRTGSEPPAPAAASTAAPTASLAEFSKAWLASLPPLQEGQFLIPLQHDGSRVIACMRELAWPEMLDIEVVSFRHDDALDKDYFAGAYERREQLLKALVWIAEADSDRIERNDGYGQILSVLSREFVESLWAQYQARVAFTQTEANALYASAVRYFRGEAQAGYPVPSLVVEVDYMCKNIVSFSRQEFRKLTVGELERIQLILAARADALGLHASGREEAQPQVNNQPPMPDIPAHILQSLPPALREQYQKKR